MDLADPRYRPTQLSILRVVPPAVYGTFIRHRLVQIVHRSRRSFGRIRRLGLVLGSNAIFYSPKVVRHHDTPTEETLHGFETKYLFAKRLSLNGLETNSKVRAAAFRCHGGSAEDGKSLPARHRPLLMQALLK